jgi:hypothetical protein
MSTYAVWGMTRHRAVLEARERVPTHEHMKPIDETVWIGRVNEYADNIMDGNRCIQLSEKFDAPQFAAEFLEIARKSASRSLHIKAHCYTGEKDPKTKKPVKKWVELGTPAEAAVRARVGFEKALTA